MKKSRFLVTSLVIIGCVIIALAFFGYWYIGDETWDDAIYRTLQLFIIGAQVEPHVNLPVNIARFIAPLVTIVGGSAIIIYLSQKGWEKICRFFYRNHTIVCGYGETGKAIVSQLEKAGKKHIIIIDSTTIDHNDYSLPKIFLKANGNDFDIWEKETRYRKASDIIIATGSDYYNLLIRDKVINMGFTGNVYYRIEQLNDNPNTDTHEDEIVECSERRCKFLDKVKTIFGYPLSYFKRKCGKTENNGNTGRTVRRFSAADLFVHSNELGDYHNKKIVVLGLGCVGKRIVDKYYEDNEILVIEQSDYPINISKDRYDEKTAIHNKNIHYKKENIQGLVKSNLEEICKENFSDVSNNHYIVFICLGGDWSGFKTAFDWQTWNGEGMELDIHLVGMDINPGLFRRGHPITVHNLNESLYHNLVEG